MNKCLTHTRFTRDSHDSNKRDDLRRDEAKSRRINSLSSRNVVGSDSGKDGNRVEDRRTKGNETIIRA